MAYAKVTQEPTSAADTPSAPPNPEEKNGAKKSNVWGGTCSVILTLSGIVVCILSLLGDGTLWGRLMSLAAGTYMWWGAFNTAYKGVKKRQSPSQEMGNTFFSTFVNLLFYSSLWAMPFFALRHWLVAWLNPIGCLSWGSMTGWLIYVWSASRERSGKTGCCTWFVTRALRDPPNLAAGYLLDRGVSSCFGSPPWLFYHDGSGGLVSVINTSICMGGRPLAQHVPLLQEHGVHSVINMTCECAGPVTAYSTVGIVQLQLPTLDNTPPSVEDLRRGVAFAKERLNQLGGGRVYVHCRGGRGRAAVMVLCLLMSMESVGPEAAFERMKARRSVVEKIILKYRCIQEFAASEGSEEYAALAVPMSPQVAPA